MKRDTDHLILTSKMLREMRECSTREGECLIYPYDHVEARPRGEVKTVNVPLGAAVFAMTHAHDHVSPDERVATTCGNPFCIEEGHQVKVSAMRGQSVRKNGKVRARSTNVLDINDDVEGILKAMCEPQEDGCLLFSRAKGRHLHVKALNEIGRVLVSVRRIAYAITHPGETVSEDEDVIITCHNKGNCNTGDGCCLNPDHLVKVPSFHKTLRDQPQAAA